jgi:hypothetical protein
MSQQSKCDRCGAVADKAPSPGFGSNAGQAPGWAQLHIHRDGVPITLDLCDKCFSESIDGAGLALAMKKAETVHETAYGSMGAILGGDDMGPTHHHHHGPVRPLIRRGPPPQKPR